MSISPSAEAASWSGPIGLSVARVANSILQRTPTSTDTLQVWLKNLELAAAARVLTDPLEPGEVACGVRRPGAAAQHRVHDLAGVARVVEPHRVAELVEDELAAGLPAAEARAQVAVGPRVEHREAGDDAQPVAHSVRIPRLRGPATFTSRAGRDECRLADAGARRGPREDQESLRAVDMTRPVVLRQPVGRPFVDEVDAGADLRPRHRFLDLGEGPARCAVEVDPVVD